MWLGILLSLMASGGLVFSNGALAGKPDKPGGGKGDKETPPGTVYFERKVDSQWELWAMKADGSNKQMVLPFVYRPAEPSRQMHGGHVWFLGLAKIDGTYPDETRRRELVAVDDTGYEVTLAVAADIQPFASRVSVRWSRHLPDALISFVG